MVFQAGRDPFYTHEGHMDPGQCRGHSDVTLVGNRGDVPGFGSGQVASGNPHIGR
jgi:hypothetical protein